MRLHGSLPIALMAVAATLTACAGEGSLTRAGSESGRALDRAGIGDPPVAVRLTDWPGVEDSPRFSPDGNWVAFHATVDGQTDLYAKRLADGELRRLTESGTVDRRPAWSPDGQALAYQSVRDGVTGVWSVPFAGGEPTPVFHRPGLTAIAPEFGPDGRLVATVIEPNPSRRIGDATPWVMAADGAGARSLTDHGDEWYGRWDADGEWLYYYVGTGDDIGAVHVETGEIRDVNQGRFVGWRPAPSPDGQTLAFVSSPGWTVWVWGLDGASPPVAMTEIGHDDFPSFSPDGRHVAFSADRAPRDIVELDPATGERTVVAQGVEPQVLDGERLAYLSDEKPAKLTILDRARQTSTVVDLPDAIVYRFAFSAQERRLALVTIPGATGGGHHLDLAAGDGSGVRRIVAGRRVESPLWCGDDDVLFVSRADGEDFRQIHRVDLQTGTHTALTDSPGNKLITACAADRSWISYRYTSGAVGAGVIDAVDGGWEVRFETDSREGALSPDGTRFAEVRVEDGRTDLFLRDASGDRTRLTDDDLAESSPRWSPDGERLVFVARRVERDLWMAPVPDGLR